MREEWILCPFCKSKTRLKIQENTVLENFPLFCPKCRQKALVNVKQFKMSMIKEPDAHPQAREERSYYSWLSAFFALIRRL